MSLRTIRLKTGPPRKRGQGREVHPSMQDLIGIVARHNRDIEHIKTFTSVPSARNWIARNEKEGWSADLEDLDNNPNTPKNVAVRRAGGALHAVDGFVTVEPKQRPLFREYYDSYDNPEKRKANKWSAYMAVKNEGKARTVRGEFQHRIIAPTLKSNGMSKSPNYLKILNERTTEMWRKHFCPLILGKYNAALRGYDFMNDEDNQKILKRNADEIKEIWHREKENYIAQHLMDENYINMIIGHAPVSIGSGISSASASASSSLLFPTSDGKMDRE